jgi:hypothetical protein
MRYYLAGPMRGIPYFNFPAFAEAAEKLRAEGHTVLSPAEADIEILGDLASSNLTGSEEQATKEHGFDIRDAMKRDLAWICDEAEGIALLPGWESSKGARVENALAECLGLHRRFM